MEEGINSDHLSNKTDEKLDTMRNGNIDNLIGKIAENKDSGSNSCQVFSFALKK